MSQKTAAAGERHGVVRGGGEVLWGVKGVRSSGRGSGRGYGHEEGRERGVFSQKTRKTLKITKDTPQNFLNAPEIPQTSFETPQKLPSKL